jgi:hypothetical protein
MALDKEILKASIEDALNQVNADAPEAPKVLDFPTLEQFQDAMKKYNDDIQAAQDSSRNLLARLLADAIDVFVRSAEVGEITMEVSQDQNGQLTATQVGKGSLA